MYRYDPPSVCQPPSVRLLHRPLLSDGDERRRAQLPCVRLADPSVLKQGKSPKECLSNKDNLPLQCQHLLASFSDCKRGLVSVAAAAAMKRAPAQWAGGGSG